VELPADCADLATDDDIPPPFELPAAVLMVRYRSFGPSTSALVPGAPRVGQIGNGSSRPNSEVLPEPAVGVRFGASSAGCPSGGERALCADSGRSPGCDRATRCDPYETRSSPRQGWVGGLMSDGRSLCSSALLREALQKRLKSRSPNSGVRDIHVTVAFRASWNHHRSVIRCSW
jgi:hypothetical protein